MSQPVHLTSESAFPSSSTGIAWRRFSIVCCACAIVACGSEAATPEGGAGSGGAAAGSGGPGTGAAAGTGGAAGASAGTNAAGSGGAGAGGSGADNSSLYGYFNIALNPAVEETSTAANTTLLGKIYDGATPTPMSWLQKDSVDDCKLYTPNPVLCEPGCTSTSACVNGKCVDYPTSKTVGNAHLTGLGSAELTLMPRANNYQLPAGTMLAYPPCAPGAKITLAADGGTYAGFSLEATCIAPLMTAASVKLQKGKPVAMRWDASTVDSSRMHLLVDISQHGTSKGRIECDTADDGSLDIGSKLSDALLELGFSGFPTVLLTRSTESKAGGGAPANVKLAVNATYRAAIEIDGLTSCVDDSQCPQGQKCQADLKCM